MTEEDYCEKCDHALATHLPRGTCRHVMEKYPDGKTRKCGCRDFTVNGVKYLVTETSESPYYTKKEKNS